MRLSSWIDCFTSSKGYKTNYLSNILGWGIIKSDNSYDYLL